MIILAQSIGDWQASDWVNFIATVAGTLSVIGGILAGIWWLVLPRVRAWARKELLDPMQRVDRQVTENGHINESPTILDKLDTLSRSFNLMRDNVQRHHNMSSEFSIKVESRLRSLEQKPSQGGTAAHNLQDPPDD